MKLLPVRVYRFVLSVLVVSSKMLPVNGKGEMVCPYCDSVLRKRPIASIFDPTGTVYGWYPCCTLCDRVWTDYPMDTGHFSERKDLLKGVGEPVGWKRD